MGALVSRAMVAMQRRHEATLRAIGRELDACATNVDPVLAREAIIIAYDDLFNNMKIRTRKRFRSS